MTNVPLQGSCLVFSPIYIKVFNGLYDRTFLYAEEDILYYIVRKHKMKTLYSPELKIFHKEDSSTNAQFSRNKDKRKFVYKNTMKSIIVFQVLIFKYEVIKKIAD
jgi:GT2 family glycosyltransferase